MVELFHLNNEPLLHSQILHDVRLVEYQPYNIKINLADVAPKDLIPNMLKSLKAWTQKDWNIEVTDQAGDISLLQQDRAEKAAEMDLIKQDPFVKEIIEAFPGAKISVKE